MKRAALLPEFRELLRSLPRDNRHNIGRKITALEQSFGQPHLHRGLGIRWLRDDYYEIRLGLKQRLVFRNLPDCLLCEMIANHNEVKRFIKSR